MTLDLDALRGHTAGPWDVDYGYEDYGDGPVQLVYGIYAGKQRIVETDSGVYEMSIADAKLICAAPQLLSELLAYRARDAETAKGLASIRRYDPQYHDASMETNRDGDWVKYEDVEKLTASRDAAVAELEKDAARYRWLRDNWHGGNGCWCDPEKAPADLDAAIDAAFRQGAADER